MEKKSSIGADFTSVKLIGGFGYWKAGFFQEDEGASSENLIGFREILVADDKADARDAARMALKGIELIGKPLRLILPNVPSGR